MRVSHPAHPDVALCGQELMRSGKVVTEGTDQSETVENAVRKMRVRDDTSLRATDLGCGRAGHGGVQSGG